MIFDLFFLTENWLAFSTSKYTKYVILSVTREKEFFKLVNNTHKEKLCFTHFSTRIYWNRVQMFKQGDSSNNGTRDFSDSLPFERSLCFYVTITEIFEHFQYFNLEKNEKLFQKTEVLLFSWNYWDWKCNISMQNCSVRSHVKTNRMGSTKWTYQTLQVTTSLFFFFLILFRYKDL